MEIKATVNGVLIEGDARDVAEIVKAFNKNIPAHAKKEHEVDESYAAALRNRNLKAGSISQRFGVDLWKVQKARRKLHRKGVISWTHPYLKPRE